MKTLKEKWTEALPVLASIFFVIGIMFSLVWGISKLMEGDPRTVDEIKIERYKNCLKYTNAEHAERCKNFIK